ncbi:MAG: hypothetical protein WCH99_19000, partial [Verrucomicrobiota bacterium]
MTRKLREEYAGAIYRVINRGDRRELVFRDDEYRRRLFTMNGAGSPAPCSQHFGISAFSSSALTVSV